MAERAPSNAEKVRRIVDSGELRLLLEKRFPDEIVNFIINAVYRRSRRRHLEKEKDG